MSNKSNKNLSEPNGDYKEREEIESVLKDRLGGPFVEIQDVNQWIGEMKDYYVKKTEGLLRRDA